jgi:hypothetical protein
MVWFFDRNDETLSCETRRVAAGYELVINRPDGSSDVRTFDRARGLIDGLIIVPNELMQQEWRPRLMRVFP